MRSGVQVSNARRILCVNARSLDGYEMRRAYDVVPQIKAFMMPLGILTVASYLPAKWQARVVDENVRPVSDEDLEWADAVFSTGMHVQREPLRELADRAHRHGKIAVLGGPSVSAFPEYHPDFDILHVGEIGDATDALIEMIDRTVGRPPSQVLLRTTKRLSIEDFPIPAYDQVNFNQYYVSSIQWSSGCPFRCEFCDIPELYGRVPRFKSPERLIAELDAIIERSPIGGIYFVDDNLIGNKKAAKHLLSHLVAWQRRRGYPARFAAECTINVATDPELLSLMREAHFTDVFFGIESADEGVLRDIDKAQNVRIPLVDAVRIINSYGIELSAGIVFGFDSDKADAGERTIRFVLDSNIPFVMGNILTALPKTPLWNRLDKEGRILRGRSLYGMNMAYKLDPEHLIQQWRTLMSRIHEPAALYRRFRHQIEHTLPNRLKLPLKRFRVTPALIETAARTFAGVISAEGVKASHRAEFWKMAMATLRMGDLNQLLYWGTMGRYFISLGDDARTGALSHQWFYGPRWAAADTESRAPALVSSRTKGSKKQGAEAAD